jgi:hypothetical protein
MIWWVIWSKPAYTAPWFLDKPGNTGEHGFVKILAYRPKFICRLLTHQPLNRSFSCSMMPYSIDIAYFFHADPKDLRNSLKLAYLLPINK